MIDFIIKPGNGYIDTYVSTLILKTVPFWRRIHVGPNFLTTLGLISSILSLYYLYYRKAIYAIIFLILRWYFDYADGIFARKYNKVTKFGDYYDHIVDILYSIGIIFVIAFSKYPKKPKYIRYYFLLIFFIFYILFMFQMGCIEKEYIKEFEKVNKASLKETTLSYFRYICPSNYIDIIKIFDNGTLYIVTIIIFIFFSYFKP